MVEDQQEAGPLELGLLDALIQCPVASHRREQGVELRCRARFFVGVRLLTIGQQVVVVLPELLAKVGQALRKGALSVPVSCSGGLRESNTAPVAQSPS